MFTPFLHLPVHIASHYGARATHADIMVSNEACTVVDEGERLAWRWTDHDGFEFNLAFENASAPGYLTEKLFEALSAGAVPLYEGDPHASDWFDPDAFIDCTGLDADQVFARVQSATRERLPAYVDERREALVRVRYETLMTRLWVFADALHSELAGEPDWGRADRLRRLRLDATTPRQHRLREAALIARDLIQPLSNRLPERVRDALARRLFSLWKRL